jgi:hypothetical protein
MYLQNEWLRVYAQYQVLAQHRRFCTSPTRENCAKFGHEFWAMTMALTSHPTHADSIHFNFYQ